MQLVFGSLQSKHCAVSLSITASEVLQHHGQQFQVFGHRFVQTTGIAHFKDNRSNGRCFIVIYLVDVATHETGVAACGGSHAW